MNYQGILFLICFPFILTAQVFYTGADLSYVNEMEACGANFRENNISKDPYQVFADHGCNLVRLRLWHTPNWYDTLNMGNRYSDLADVKQSIQRAKNADMPVLLDFHLSDTWADPGKQIVPAAWSAIVDDLDILQDSLYQYIYSTLEQLHNDNLLPDMVQIGNEVNRGILQSEAANQAGWALDWDRNGVLFNRAIAAVRDIETITGTEIPIALHISGPDSGDWYFENFIAQGVTDFQFIGLSYYTQWHGDLSFTQMADYITQLKTDYDREVIIMEVGYPWTNQNMDAANNILNTSHPDYQPFSPSQQNAYLMDLAAAIKNAGGIGMVYWEPAWVSTSCNTPWGNGSHYDNATFFDGQHNLINDGGIQWMENITVSSAEPFDANSWRAFLLEGDQYLQIESVQNVQVDSFYVQLSAMDGRLVFQKEVSGNTLQHKILLPDLPGGNYTVSILVKHKPIWSKSIFIAF